MSKKNKKSNQQQNHSRPQIEAPYVVDMDALAYASDDDLRERFGYLNSTRDQALRMGVDPYLWEVELAYVQRENGIRESRRLAHEKYVRLNPQEFDTYDNNFDFESAEIN